MPIAVIIPSEAVVLQIVPVPASEGKHALDIFADYGADYRYQFEPVSRDVDLREVGLSSVFSGI